ncbi:MAG: hypothetical protein ABH873_04235 [Candidatus Firestonebacteria bacterium]
MNKVLFALLITVSTLYSEVKTNEIELDLGIIPNVSRFIFRREIKIAENEEIEITNKKVSCDCLEIQTDVLKDKKGIVMLNGSFSGPKDTNERQYKIQYLITLLYKVKNSQNEQTFKIKVIGKREESIDIEPDIENYKVVDQNTEFQTRHKVKIRHDEEFNVFSESKDIVVTLKKVESKIYDMLIKYKTDKIGCWSAKIIFKTKDSANEMNITWVIKNPLCKDTAIVGGLLKVKKYYKIDFAFNKSKDFKIKSVKSKSEKLSIKNIVSESKGDIIVVNFECCGETPESIEAEVVFETDLNDENKNIAIPFSAVFYE